MFNREAYGLMGNHEKKYCMHYGNPKGEENEKGTENMFKAIMAENFPNLGKEIDIQIHEA